MPVPPRPPAGAAPRRPRTPPRQRRGRPGRRRWGKRTVTAFSVAVLAAAGIGHAVVTTIDQGIERVDAFKDMKNRPSQGHGINLLLVGTDGRDKITEKERRRYRLGGAPCHCTDTLMVVHVSGDRKRVSVVSLPRDSYATLPPHHDRISGKDHHAHPAKLNAAYAEGGPQLTVRTVEKMSHLKIDHYMEVDFVSFMKTVDVLGGVDICTTRPLKDSYTGLNLPAGRHRLGGGQALQFVRSRHVDGTADLGRMQRQQRFMAALVAEATSSGVLLNPVKFRNVAHTVLGSVRADKGFDADEMVDLGQAMRNVSLKSSEFTTVPIDDAGHTVKGIGSTVKWDPVKSKAIFDALRADRPLAAPHAAPRAKKVDVAPGQIRVQVENGTATAGLGDRVDGALRATGFATTGSPKNAHDRDTGRTVVAYDPRWDRSAKSLAAALPGSELRAVKGQGPVLRVIAGADFRKVERVRAADPVNVRRPPAVTGDEVSCD
ncbi:LCP family protein [Streptomyces sp. NPDC050560]|uniref:LCP family protein n=1 Tax=Streptomyces sp. NPDC050560 TaxID=3365630 RepID=UPI003795CFC4